MCDVACVRKWWRVSLQLVMELGYILTQAGKASVEEQRRRFEATHNVVTAVKPLRLEASGEGIV